MLWRIVFLVFCVKSVVLAASDSELNTFGYCIKQTAKPNIVSCIGQQALSSLQSFEESDNFTITNGLLMIKDETSASRSLPNFLEQDPNDFRSMLENAGAVFGQRTIQWELDRIYPGLCLRIGPSHDSNSVLEFIVDPNQDRGDRYIQEESTPRILAKQFILPFLLGLKFNLATILPLILAGIILLVKKAAFLAKFGIFISGLFGFGSLFSAASLFGGYGGGGYGGYGYSGFKPHGGGFGSFSSAHTTLQDDHHLSDGYYKKSDNWQESSQIKTQQVKPDVVAEAQTLADNFYDYEKKVLGLNRVPKQYERDLVSYDDHRHDHEFRNFAWQTVN